MKDKLQEAENELLSACTCYDLLYEDYINGRASWESLFTQKVICDMWTAIYLAQVGKLVKNEIPHIAA